MALRLTAAKEKLTPFVLTVAVIAADQISKLIVVRTLPLARPVRIIGDFLRLTYVTNPVIAFSIGRNLPAAGRHFLALVLPLAVLGVLVYYQLFSPEIGRRQRWLLAAIIGGGLGNYVDRLFRTRGVVDFIDVRFYGLLGFERWPTFNLADSTVVVAGILLIISYFRASRKEKA
jgi:signal peptidase II